MVDFSAVIQNLKGIGFYDVFLPFILVYAVVFAVLEKSAIFSKSDNDKQSRSVNSVIAFVFGLFVVASIQTVKVLQGLIINIVVVIIFILVVLILMGFIFGKDYFEHLFKDSDGKVKKGIVWTVAGVVLLVATGVLFAVLGVWEWLSKYNLGISGDDVTSAIVVITIIAVLVWVTKGNDNGGSD